MRVRGAVDGLAAARAAEEGGALVMAHVHGIRGTCGIEVTARAVEVRLCPVGWA